MGLLSVLPSRVGFEWRISLWFNVFSYSETLLLFVSGSPVVCTGGMRPPRTASPPELPGLSFQQVGEHIKARSFFMSPHPTFRGGVRTSTRTPPYRLLLAWWLPPNWSSCVLVGFDGRDRSRDPARTASSLFWSTGDGPPEVFNKGPGQDAGVDNSTGPGRSVTALEYTAGAVSDIRSEFRIEHLSGWIEGRALQLLNSSNNRLQDISTGPPLMLARARIRMHAPFLGWGSEYLTALGAQGRFPLFLRWFFASFKILRNPLPSAADFALTLTLTLTSLPFIAALIFPFCPNCRKIIRGLPPDVSAFPPIQEKFRTCVLPPIFSPKENRSFGEKTYQVQYIYSRATQKLSFFHNKDEDYRVI